MAPWLTFVVGVIVGLVIGWLLDMIYRRAPRPEVMEQGANLPDWAQPLPAATPAPETAGVAAASAAAVAAVDDEGLDVPPGSETATATEEVDWRAVSSRVDEVADEVDRPGVTTAQLASELADEGGLPPSAVDTLAPRATDDEEARGPSERL